MTFTFIPSIVLVALSLVTETIASEKQRMYKSRSSKTGKDEGSRNERRELKGSKTPNRKETKNPGVRETKKTRPKRY